jgi:PAS domain S-box-containing protein
MADEGWEGLDLRQRLERLGGVASSSLRKAMEARNASLPDLAHGEFASMLVLDAELRIIDVHGPLWTTPGFRREDLLGESLPEVLMPDADRDWLLERYRAAAGGKPQSFEYFGPGGHSVYRVQILGLGAAGREPGLLVSITHDITAVAEMTVALSQSEARLKDAERMIGVGSWELDRQERSLTYSSGFARLLGLTAATLSLDEFAALVHPGDRENFLAELDRTAREGSGGGLLRIRNAAGEVRIFEGSAEAVPPSTTDPPPRYLRGAVLDVTEQRRAERDRSEAIALFQQGFDAAPIGMALIEPQTTRYLRVNPALGEILGRSPEELLALTALDVLHPDSRPALIAEREKLLSGEVSRVESERRYVRPDGSAVWLSVHVAPVAHRDGSPRVLFAQHLDVTERKTREARMLLDLADAQWLARIRDALDQDRFRLYAQPIVDLRTGETVQRELLLRMLDGDGTAILPGEFLPVAERFGLINEIDRWVIRAAVEIASSSGPCEFNLSGASLSDPTVLSELGAALERTGVDPRTLVVEVTETTMMDSDAGESFARAVTALGCGLALDDFGTGYASLSYLKRIPATHLKIDIEFIRELVRNATDQRMVRGIVGLAKQFGQFTIAEGIEDEETLLLVRAIGVTHGQGFLFGRPEPLRPLGDPGSGAGHPEEPVSEDALRLARQLFKVLPAPLSEAELEMLHDEIVLRPSLTMRQAGRTEPYRGRQGVLDYFRDLTEVWDDLHSVTTRIRPAGPSVIAFGQVTGVRDGRREVAETLSVVRFRDGKIISIETVQTQAPHD